MRYVFTDGDRVLAGKSVPHHVHVMAGRRSVELKRGAHAFTKEQLSAAGRKGGLAHRGRAKSKEHREKISEIMTAIWAARREAKSKSGDPLLITE